jgi:hypothetical protein
MSIGGHFIKVAQTNFPDSLTFLVPKETEADSKTKAGKTGC